MDSKDAEIQRLRRLLEAYDRLSDFSHRELLDAKTTIDAHETLADLSRGELLILHEKIAEFESRDGNLQSRIRNIISEDDRNEEKILDDLDDIRKKSHDGFYVDFFRVLTQHVFTEDEAVSHWQGIHRHAVDISRALDRPVGFRVAMLDYFVNKNKVLHNPMIIEINMFDEVLMNTMIDELTGIYNRRFFETAFRKEFNRARRHGHTLCLLMIDVDNFKSYNDRNGHAAGDEALRKVGALFRSTFRSEDSPCRYGGEEFVVLLPETRTEQARLVGERLVQAAAALELSTGPVTLSGGVAEYPEHATEANTLFLQADAALYRAKLAGKNQIQVSPGAATL